eukprot:comp7204_c0_seq1/m.2916 comp7204_c0_seq1/g.2916  ORF comp7204_c0_seq1/g.2916 comp7204_c0_seq1/m.2916 type:complete len:133 (-) comp7204_c0_seq1:195-593(-)
MPALPATDTSYVQLEIFFGNVNWVFLGLLDMSAPANDKSYCDGGAYGWACGSRIFKAGNATSGDQGWTGFQQGDRVVLKIDRNNSTLSMRVARLGVQTFTMTIPNCQLYVHVNLYSNNDQVKLVKVDPALVF